MIVIKDFFDPATFTLTYVAYNPDTKDAVVIDPVWDYDPNSSMVSETSYNLVKAFIAEKNLHLHAILETHAHADHLTGSQLFKREYSHIKVLIGHNITKVQSTFKKIYNLGNDFKTDGSQFDQLLHDGEKIYFNAITIEAIATPGHTPACMTYRIGNYLFTGDALFMPDYGTGRCDFPDGSADDLFASVKRLYEMSDELIVCTGHDYQPGGRPMQWHSTLAEQKRSNIQLNEHTSREEFISYRQKRDKTLTAPRLLLPSVQVNIDAGHLPRAESNGMNYLKIPIR